MYVTAIAPGGSGGLAALNPEQLQSDEPELLFSSYVGGLGLEVPTSADLGNCPPPIEGPCFFFAGQTESVNLQTTANAPADLGQIAPHDAFVLLRQPQVLPGLPGSLDEAIDLFPVGAGKAETAAGGHKLPHLLQREMLSMLPGGSHSPAVCPDPTAVFSGSSRVGNTPPFQDHLALDNSVHLISQTALLP